MDHGFLDLLIKHADENDPIDLSDVETSRFLRDLDVPLVAVLWRDPKEPDKVHHWLTKHPPTGVTVEAMSFWLTNLPKDGFKIVDTPNGPEVRALEMRQRSDGKLEVIGPTDCADCGMKTGIRGEWYLVHDEVWQKAWQGAEAYLAGNDHSFLCEEILCIGCLEKRLGRQLTPADFPKGEGPHPWYRSKRLRNRMDGA